MERLIEYHDLLKRISKKLIGTPPTTDHRILVRWRIGGICQYLLGSSKRAALKPAMDALECFVEEGVSSKVDKALAIAMNAINKEDPHFSDSILPTITKEKRTEVLKHLEMYETQGKAVIENTIKALPILKENLKNIPEGSLTIGLRHRLFLISSILCDTSRTEQERCRAAAAVQYLAKIKDVIPDDYGYIGLLDDDYALRVVLKELGIKRDNQLHWVERISQLWSDIPFLRGVDLKNKSGDLLTTWLDRVNSFLCYEHTIAREKDILILIQPSVACSPLYSIISLLGLLVLESLTSTRNFIESLKVGQVYKVDNKYFVSFEGISTEERVSGWLRLRTRNGIIIVPPSTAGRMVEVPPRSLSKSESISINITRKDSEPVQKFFAWKDAIGAASISSRVILVTSKKRAEDLFYGVESNGVSLTNEGLIKYIGMNPSPDIMQNCLVFVTPTVSAARSLVEQGLDAYVIIIDGYERLKRGRHELPFLSNRKDPLPIIVWSPYGYFPNDPPSWLPSYKLLNITPEELSDVLEIDRYIDNNLSPVHESLSEAALGLRVEDYIVSTPINETMIVKALEKYRDDVRQIAGLPEYWKYFLQSSIYISRLLLTATPAYWSDIKTQVDIWNESFEKQWSMLRPRAMEAFEHIRHGQQDIMNLFNQITSDLNSKGASLLKIAEEMDKDWLLACSHPTQLNLSWKYFRRLHNDLIRPVLLEDLNVCRDCIIPGWMGSSFALKLLAHTPKKIISLADNDESLKWKHVHDQAYRNNGKSLLSAIGHHSKRKAYAPTTVIKRNIVASTSTNEAHIEDENTLTPCILISLFEEPNVKVLGWDSHVMVEREDKAYEKHAHRLCAEERVILDYGNTNSAAADQFTQAVVNVVKETDPDLIQNAREWRKALKSLKDAKSWTTEELCLQLAKEGVHRGRLTVDGWVNLHHGAPIGPRQIRKELAAIWRLVDKFTTSEINLVIEACSRLRVLKFSAGRALLRAWKGYAVNVGVDEDFLKDTVDRLRQEVRVYEVERIAYGAAPMFLIGQWVNSELATQFERYSNNKPDASETEWNEDSSEDEQYELIE